MTPPAVPRVVAVVLNLCQEELTRPCIESLLASGYPALDVLLVDNGSPDGSGERLRRAFPDISYLQTGENLGFTGGNNAGFGWALDQGADYVLALNNDTIVEEGALARLVRTADSEERVGGVCPTITYHLDPGRIWYGGGAFSPLRGLGLHWHQGEPVGSEVRRGGASNGGGRREHQHPGGREEAGGSGSDDGVPQEVSFLTGCAWLFPADVLRRYGGFAPDYFIYAEDAELSVRLRKDGYRLLHEPRARIQHKKPFDESAPSPFAIRLRDRNRRRLMRRHYGLLARLPFLAWFWPTRLVRLVQYVARGDRERVRAIVDGALER